MGEGAEMNGRLLREKITEALKGMEILPPWRRRGSKYVAQSRKSDRRINREKRSEVEVEVRSMWRTRDYVVRMPQAGFTYCRTAKS